MIIHKLKEFCKRLLLRERSVQKLARSTCVGVFIAFSPYIGLHTLLAIALCWLFSLNYPITLSVQLLINNPWTMVPVYGCDYFFGKFITGYCNIGVLQTAPVCLQWLFEPLSTTLGMSNQAVWSFVLGGNLLGILLAVLLYKPTTWIFERISNENYSSK
jgi:uncharacterized protein (DUF2062 family)